VCAVTIGPSVVWNAGFRTLGPPSVMRKSNPGDHNFGGSTRFEVGSGFIARLRVRRAKTANQVMGVADDLGAKNGWHFLLEPSFKSRGRFRQE
jgi:hypothetical protein